MKYDTIVEALKLLNVDDPYENGREIYHAIKDSTTEENMVYLESFSIDETKIIFEGFIDGSLWSIPLAVFGGLFALIGAWGFLAVVTGSLGDQIKNLSDKMNNYVTKMNNFLGRDTENEKPRSLSTNSWASLKSVVTLPKEIASSELPAQKLSRKIIESNFNNCIEKSGIDMSDIKLVQNYISEIPNLKKIDIDTLLFKLFGQRYVTGVSMDKMDEIKDKSKSIINCYLDFITTLYAELSSSYVNCLTMTGIAQPNMNNLSVDSLMQYPLDSKCKTIYDQMLFAANGFKEILDLLFKDKPQEAHDWHKVLDSKIKNLRYWKHPQNTIPFSGKGGKDKYIRM